ncbi:MAG: alpha/beta hydrolase [Rhodospirillaceae bacterium]|nr:alpha/beta hydrolase [Rhodospirillaceae bacterium]
MNIASSALQMQPHLPHYLLEPPALRWGQFRCNDGIQLRTCSLQPAEAWADAVLVGGFAEFIEKYFELMTDLATAGIAVWSFDWRGQGLSDRSGTHAVPRNFARDVNDLAAYANHITPRQRPRVLIAHSMGGAIGLRTLATHPGLFDAAVLSAPMVGVSTAGLPLWLAHTIAAGGVALGFSNALIPGLAGSALDQDIRVVDSQTSHDPIRSTLMQQWFRANPALTVDGVSFGWYDSALRFCQSFSDLSPFRHVTTPVLLGTTGHDVFVRNGPIDDVARALPHATRRHYPDAKHELFHERDDIRTDWVNAVITFLRSNSARTNT